VSPTSASPSSPPSPCHIYLSSRHENPLSSSLSDESPAAEDTKEAHEEDHRRISAAYEGAEELLHRVLNNELSADYDCPTEDSLEPPSPPTCCESKDAADEESPSLPASPTSQIPAFQPPARRTSRLMMSFLSEDLPPPSPSPSPTLDIDTLSSPS
jgi:hypothetical protein